MATTSERTEQKIATTVRVVVRPEDEQLAVDLMERMARMAAMDDGTEIWVFHRGPRGSHEFFTYELFRDRAALAVHQANEELMQLGREFQDLAVELHITSGRLRGGFHPFD